MWLREQTRELALKAYVLAISFPDHILQLESFKDIMAATNSTDSESQTVDLSPQRPSLKARSDLHRRGILSAILIKQLRFSCNCDECEASAYHKRVYPCIARHDPNELIVQKGLRPTLTYQFEHGTYNAPTLARSTIAYISRPHDSMDPEQQSAIASFALEAKDRDLVRKLGSSNLMSALPFDELQLCAKNLNQIFFFNAIDDYTIDWTYSELEKAPGRRIGQCATFPKDGRRRHTIDLHPTRTYLPENLYANEPKRLAEERLGTIIHELLHAFLDRYVCTFFPKHADDMNPGGHGRAWHRIAKVIEESLRVLGMERRMGRAGAMLDDWEAKLAYRPSIHDLEAFGFLEECCVAE